MSRDNGGISKSQEDLIVDQFKTEMRLRMEEEEGLSEADALQSFMDDLMESCTEILGKDAMQAAAKEVEKRKRGRSSLEAKERQQEIVTAFAAQRDEKPERMILPPKASVIIHDVEGRFSYMNKHHYYIKRFNPSTNKYLISHSDDDAEIEDEDYCRVELPIENIRPVTDEQLEEHNKQQRIEQATLYDPNGVHPPTDKEVDGWDMSELLKWICRGVEQYKVDLSCAQCGKTKSDNPPVCSSCKTVAYCSAKCQKAHWKFHKKSCTKKEYRIKLLRQRLLSSTMNAPEKHEFHRQVNDDAVLSTALDISQEFVDGAFVLFAAVRLQTTIGDDFPEHMMIKCVGELCDIRVTPKRVMKLAKAMGVGEEYETGRRAYLACFQQRERDMETPRAGVLRAWQILEPHVGTCLGTRIQICKEQHTSVRTCALYLVDQCATVRGDVGKSVKGFLQFLDELTRDVVMPSDLSEHRRVVVTIKTARTVLLQAWKDYLRAYGEHSYLAEHGTEERGVLAYRQTAIDIAIRIGVGQEEGGCSSVRLNRSHVDQWLSAAPGRWLPHDYVPGYKPHGAHGVYAH